MRNQIQSEAVRIKYHFHIKCQTIKKSYIIIYKASECFTSTEIIGFIIRNRNKQTKKVELSNHQCH